LYPVRCSSCGKGVEHSPCRGAWDRAGCDHILCLGFISPVMGRGCLSVMVKGFSGVYFLFVLVLLWGPLALALTGNVSSLTDPSTGFSSLEPWSSLSYHLLLVDGEAFPAGSPSPFLSLPYDVSVIPGGVLDRLVEFTVSAGSGGSGVVLTHMGTRFFFDNSSSPSVVKGVDVPGFREMFPDQPLLVGGRWLGEDTSGEVEVLGEGKGGGVGSGGVVLPVSLADGLGVSIGGFVSLEYFIGNGSELEEFSAAVGSYPPGGGVVLEVVGLHNETGGVSYVGRSVVDGLMGTDGPTYANIFFESPSGMADLWPGLEPFLVSGEVFPSYRRAEMDSSPRICLTGDGSLLVWDSRRTGNREVWAGSLLFGGGSLSLGDLFMVTNHSALDRNPSAMVDGKGYLWVVYDSTRSGTAQLWARFRDPGGSWGEEVQLTNSSRNNIHPCLFRYGEDLGVVWVSYEDSPLGEIQAGGLGLGGLFDVVRVTNNDLQEHHPCVISGGGEAWASGGVLGKGDEMGEGMGDDLFLFFSFTDMDWVGGGGESRSGIMSMSTHMPMPMSYTPSLGGNWSEPVVLTEGAVYDVHPSVCSLGGELWLFWSSLRPTDRGSPLDWPNPEIWYRRTIDGEVWSSPRQLTVSWGPDLDPCSVVLGGDIWVVWYSEDGEPFGRLVCSALGTGGGTGGGSEFLRPWQSFTLILVLMVLAIVLLLRPSRDFVSPAEDGVDVEG